VTDASAWTAAERKELVDAEIERAVLELRRTGRAASGQVPALLAQIATPERLDDRLVREAVLLALPRIAALPCDACRDELAAVVEAGQGKAELNELTYETSLLVAYYTWAGR
jgi:hypothetical protein